MVKSYILQKKYPREVEWEGGNLYFDKWDYNLDVEYLDK